MKRRIICLIETHLLPQQDINRHDCCQHCRLILNRLSLPSAEFRNSFQVNRRGVLDSNLESSPLRLIFLTRPGGSIFFKRQHDFTLERFLGSLESGNRRRREKVLTAVECSLSERRRVLVAEGLAVFLEDLLHEQQRQFARGSVVLWRFLAVGHANDRGDIDIVVLNCLSLSAGESNLKEVGKDRDGLACGT